MLTLLKLAFLLQSPATFRSDVALVHVDLEVRQGRAVVDGLDRSSFRVTDNGKRQEIVAFGHQEEPLDVVLLLDGRVGMRDAVRRIAEVARASLGELREEDRLAVMTVGDPVRRCKAEMAADFGESREGAAGAIDRIAQRESTITGFGCQPLLGIGEAARQLRDQPRGQRRRAIVAIVDDRGSPMGGERVRAIIRDLWESDAVVVGVSVRSAATVITIGPPYRGARYAAAQTGGDTIDNADAGEGLRETMRRLRSRYSLYYAMPEGKPGEERKVRVELTPEAARSHPGAVVRARGGYVVPSR
jgi:VWFA-related protein